MTVTKSSAGGRFRGCGVAAFVGDDGLDVTGVFVRCDFTKALEMPGVEILPEATIFDCTPAELNNATRGDVLARWPEAFDDDDKGKPNGGRSRNEFLFQDENMATYWTNRWMELFGEDMTGPVSFGGVFVRCDFRDVRYTIRPALGALFYECQGITNNATRDQILELHPGAKV